MAKLEVAYEIPEGAFPEIITGLKEYLTPKTEPSIFTQFYLERFTGALTAKLEPYSFLDASIQWDFADSYAKDLGLFPLERDDADKPFKERYLVPITPGCKTSYGMLFFGKNVNGVGDSPMTIRMSGDSRGHSDELYLLRDWYECFKKEGRERMVNGIIDAGIRANGVSPEHSTLLAGMPRTDGEFERRIERAKQRLTLTMIEWSIGMARFYWDFFGVPIKRSGYLPVNTEFHGDYEVRLLLSERDLEIISEYPTLSKEEVVRRIFPKPKDDIQLVQ